MESNKICVVLPGKQNADGVSGGDKLVVRGGLIRVKGGERTAPERLHEFMQVLITAAEPRKLGLVESAFFHN